MTQPINIKNSIEYSPNSIVSKTIIDKKSGTVTLFAFDQGQGLSEHTVPFDALASILEGEAEIIIGAEKNIIKAEESILMPADIPHAVKANKKFKMLLVMIKN